MTGAPEKWRPSLVMVTAGMISLVLIVAIGGFAVVRFNIDRPPGVEMVTAFTVAMIAAFTIGAVFVRTITRPLRELVRRADLITHGDDAAIGPLVHHGTRELAALSDSFMTMAQSLSDRSTYLRTYSRHVSHELKTPLTGIRGAAELMLDSDVPPAQQKRFLQNIVADVARMTQLLEKLNQHARADAPPQATPAPLSAALDPLEAKFPQLRIEIIGDASLRVTTGADNLHLVLHHLAANARQHGANRLRIEITRVDADCRLTVQDDGAGVTAGNRDRIFDPFFTTRREDGGTGMGLTIARSMLEAHRGAIALEDSTGGARFVLRLPLAGEGLHKNC